MERAEIVNRLVQNKEKQIRKKIGFSSVSVEKKALPMTNVREGISVIIPTYKGEKVIATCLKSLANQTLAKELFEIIIVINGEKDQTETIIQEYIVTHELSNVIVYSMEEAGASQARNKGIALANREYILFLDDDDYVTANYLEGLYGFADNETVVISQIVDVHTNGKKDGNNPINVQIKLADEKNNSVYQKLGMILTINACKLLPAKFVKSILYHSHLRSGEDVVYYTELFVRYNLKVRVAPITEDIIYYRLLRESSVSRQGMTFSFYVQQRMEVIFHLNRLLLLADNEEKVTFIKQKICAQASFLNKYLSENPHERNRVITEIKSYQLFFFPYSLLNKGLAETLVISYCFPPYVDTSGNVVAKRLRDKNQVVDIVYNNNRERNDSNGDMVERERDSSLEKIFEDLVEDTIGVFSPFSFSDWSAIKQFCEEGLRKIKEKKKTYRTVYSRVLWPASHFLALEYKLANPKVKWIAEFSDPIILDIHGKERKGNITDQKYIEKMKLLLKEKKLPMPKSKNLFFWCEYIAYVFADEIVFTNPHQCKYMQTSFPIVELREIIEKKAKVERQPTLPKEYYAMVSSTYKICAAKVNFAYFGAFYGTRKLNVLFTALEKIKDTYKDKIQLHIFTVHPEELKEEIKNKECDKFTKINSYVEFYEFLYLTTKFDCLIVNDAVTVGLKGVNPYLPSKLSDYLGSGRSILGLYEQGSILHKSQLQYKANVNNENEIVAILEKIIEDHLQIK